MKLSILIAIAVLALSANAATSDTLALSELTVTAIKQQTDLRSEATSITVIDSEEAERNQVVSPKTAADLVPNLFIPDYGSRMTSTVYVRGIGTRIDQPAVGLNVDNVPILCKENYDIDLLDISRFEMLRGPQSTLYGRNTMGGVINIYTLSPFNWQGTRLLVEGATHATWRFGASHYAKFNDRWAMSLALNYFRTGGEFKNLYNGKRCDKQRQFGARAKVEWKPSPSMFVANVLSVGVNRQGGYPYEWLETGEISYNDTCFYRRTNVMDGLTVRKDFGDWSLSGIASYQFIDDNMTLDQDFTPLSYFTLTQKRKEHAATTDIIARSRAHTAGYDWMLGAFGYFRRYTMQAPVTFLSDGIERLIENNANRGMPDGMALAWDSRSFELGSRFISPNYGFAFYHESSYKTGGWTFTAGLRLDYEHAALRWHSETHTSYSVTRTPPGVVIQQGNIDIDESGSLKKDFVQLLPKFSATWHPWQGKPHTVYASIARGGKAGGFNTQMFSDLLQQQLMGHIGVAAQYDVDDVVGYKPEKAWNYELGGHFECWNGRVQSDIDFFYMDCRDRQLTVFPEGTTTGRVMTNAGKTRSWGTEFDMRVRAAELTQINVSYGFTRATFVEYNDGKADYAGNRVPYAPAHTLFGEISQGILLPRQGCQLLLSANVRGVGDIYWDEENSVKQPFYALLGASVSLITPIAELRLWGTNLTGTHYNTFYFESIQHPFVQRGHGRNLGFTLQFTL